MLIAGLLCIQLKLIKFRVGYIWQLSLEICSESSRKTQPYGCQDFSPISKNLPYSPSTLLFAEAVLGEED